MAGGFSVSNISLYMAHILKLLPAQAPAAEEQQIPHQQGALIRNAVLDLHIHGSQVVTDNLTGRVVPNIHADGLFMGPVGQGTAVRPAACNLITLAGLGILIFPLPADHFVGNFLPFLLIRHKLLLFSVVLLII